MRRWRNGTICPIRRRKRRADPWWHRCYLARVSECRSELSIRGIMRRLADLDHTVWPNTRLGGSNHPMNVLVAKRLLPNMPDELFRLYMEPMIAEYGWPFYSLSSPATPAWQQLFDCHDLRTISELVWERREFTFSLGAFHRLSRQQITRLLDAHILGAKNFYATIPNTNARFHRAQTYI